MPDTATATDTVPTTRGACVDCHERGKPRGTWSPFYCEECDIVRMHRVVVGMAQIAALDDPHAEPPKDLDWYRSTSADLRAREGWWDR